jgi:hypothetical protein
MISATQLYDFVHCPHRVSRDAFGVATERDETSPFVELLWEQGLLHERTIAEGLPITANMRLMGLADRERDTLRAMTRREPLIYGGRLMAGDLVGDTLHRFHSRALLLIAPGAAAYPAMGGHDYPLAAPPQHLLDDQVRELSPAVGKTSAFHETWKVAPLLSNCRARRKTCQAKARP